MTQEELLQIKELLQREKEKDDWHYSMSKNLDKSILFAFCCLPLVIVFLFGIPWVIINVILK